MHKSLWRRCENCVLYTFWYHDEKEGFYSGPGVVLATSELRRLKFTPFWAYWCHSMACFSSFWCHNHRCNSSLALWSSNANHLELFRWITIKCSWNHSLSMSLSRLIQLRLQLISQSSQLSSTMMRAGSPLSISKKCASCGLNDAPQYIQRSPDFRFLLSRTDTCNNGQVTL